MELTPYVAVKGAAAAIDFYRSAFGAEESGARFTDKDGKIGHAELTFGESVMYLADEHPDYGAISPPTLGGTPVLFHLYVDDADRVVERAIELGATLERAVDDQDYGDRAGTIADPFGYRWMISSRGETLDKQTLQSRVGEAYDIT